MGTLITLPLSPGLPLNISAGQTKQYCMSLCGFGYLPLYQLPLSIGQMSYMKCGAGLCEWFHPRTQTQAISILLFEPDSNNSAVVACINVNVFLSNYRTSCLYYYCKQKQTIQIRRLSVLSCADFALNFLALLGVCVVFAADFSAHRLAYCFWKLLKQCSF